MGITEQQYEDIQKYLDGRMQPEELVAFEQQLQTDPLLKEFLLFEQELRLNLDYIQDNAGPKSSSDLAESNSQFDDPAFILNLIKQGNKNEAGDKTNSSPSPLHVVSKEESPVVRENTLHSFPFARYMAAAACLIFLAMGILWLASNNNEPQTVAKTNGSEKIDLTGDSKKETSTASTTSDTSKSTDPFIAKANTAALFKKYYKREEVPAQIPEQLADALNDYSAKDYVTIQQIDLENLPKSRGAEAVEGPQYVKEIGTYFKGLSYIETANYQQAISYLQRLADNATNSQLKGSAQWYLALSYLKINHTGKAVSLLTAVSNNVNAVPFKRDAEEILVALKGAKKQAE